MTNAHQLTVGDVAELLRVAPWQVRRAVDSIGVVLPRAGQYRLIPRGLVPAIEADLRAKGHIQDEVTI